MLKRSLPILLIAAIVAGCGQTGHRTHAAGDVPGVASSPDAPGARWLALGATARRTAVQSCRSEAAARFGGAAQHRALRFPLATLDVRLQSYYATAAARLDPLPLACTNVLRQQVDARVAITRPERTVRVGVATRFLMVRGTVTPGAQVELIGGEEHDRRATVIGDRFVGTVEVAPGRNDFVAEARFNGHVIRSQPLHVMRIGGRSDDDEG